MRQSGKETTEMSGKKRAVAWIDDMHHESGLPLHPTISHASQTMFYDFGVSYREAELAAERRRYEQRRAATKAPASK